MKTMKRTISIELPATREAVTSGLDGRALYPSLAEAEREVSDAKGQLDDAREDLRQRRVRVEHFALTDDAVSHAREYTQAQAAQARIPVLEARVARANVALQEAHQDAAAAALTEARRRHEVILAATKVLVAELRNLEQLEDVLNQRLAQLPVAVAGGVNSLGNTFVRDAANLAAVAI